MAKDLTEALRLLTGVDPNSLTNSPEPLKDRWSAAKQKSSTLNTAKGSGGGSGGGPFTETAYADRTYWATRMKTTPDGIFTMALKPIKKIKMTDAAGGDASILLKDPPP